MKSSWKSSAPIHKHKCVVLKLGITILATALALRVFLHNSSGFPPQSQSQSALLQQSKSTPITHSSANVDEFLEPSHSFDDEPTYKDKQTAEQCDLFKGEWIPNPAGPAYTHETCDLIENHQNCMKNGRPDSGYLYWRWKPTSCELPKFNAKRFLETMRDKSWALIGDSISRNHIQSLLCMLSQVEKPDMFYHDEGYKSKGFHYQSHNLTIYVIWSPFLTQAAIFEDINGVSDREIELHLDRLDRKWTDLYPKLDYMIFATGKWFLKGAIYYENTTILGCHYCPTRNITEVGFEFAYRRSLRAALDFIATSAHKGVVFFRTSTPDHFEGGEWSSGGKCDRTAPFRQGQVDLKDLHKVLRTIELEEFEIASAKAEQNGVNLKLLDFVPLSLLRPDGHPGPYRQFHPFAEDKNARVQYDCLHWCLPGPIDAWNDVIMEILMKGL